MGLEMSLSKLLFAPAAQHVQIIGMSATSELGACCVGKGGMSAGDMKRCAPALPEMATFVGGMFSGGVAAIAAAVGGLEHLRAWLRAELFLTNFRPVPLFEHAVFRGKVFAKVPKEVRAGQHECCSFKRPPTNLLAMLQHCQWAFQLWKAAACVSPSSEAQVAG